MGVKLSLGHTVTGKITFLDQHGNPMLTPVTPDAVPVWSNVDTAVETVTASADGMSMSAVPAKVGVDTVTVVVTVGGVEFSATLDVEVTPEEQVLTKVAIAAAVA